MNSTSNLAIDRPPAPSTHMPPRGLAVNELGAHQNNLPQFQDVEEKVAAAKAHLEQATARQNAAEKIVSDARQQSAVARHKCATEREALTAAQNELGAALLANTDGEQVQRRIQDLQTRIDALTSLADAATQEAQRAEADLKQRFYSQVTQAEKDLAEAELNALLAKYAKLLEPLIPLAREISWRAPHLTLAPSYLIDVKHPHLGQLSVRDDGSLFFYLR
jgi:chromosome segregation ATPase